MQDRVQVDLGERSYPIRIGAGLVDGVGDCCAGLGLRTRALLVSDTNVDALYGDRCEASLRAAGIGVRRAVVPAGEPSKSLGVLEGLYDEAVAAGLDRNGFVVALGGGVVGDLAGYLAASWLRGVAYVQVPTSVVAMVDSAVGGKTGINLSHGKNLVGSFWQPSAVVVDLDALGTLPEREYVSGLAEVIKYGVIRDSGLFDRLEAEAEGVLARDPDRLAELVARSCEIKADVVHRDEREGGLRAILNFGHTLGHAIEKVAAYGTYLHGEAIAVGMVYAARLSVRAADLAPADARRIENLVVRYGLPAHAPDCTWPALLDATRVDKKSVSRTPRFVLADAIGTVRFGIEVDENLLAETWRELD